MKIKNPSNLPTIDYRSVKPLQGELKDLSKENYQKLKNVLEKRGFDVPLFLWKSGDTFYLMDGHQRQRVMIRENMEPYEVPYLLIDAADESEAKQKLLEITSQYGTITQEGFDEFAADLPDAELVDINFDALIKPSDGDFSLPDDDDPDFEQISFVLSKEQAKTVRLALNKAKPFAESNQNTNQNGNGISHICQGFIDKTD